jgi:uncharacterized protein (DUF1330 family)
MSTYFIARLTIHDPATYERYLERFDEVFAHFDGEVLAVDDQPVVLEGEWPCTRTVVIRFPDHEEALRWYRSASYQALARHRWDAASADIVLVEGYDQEEPA